MCGIFGSINIENTQQWSKECCRLLAHRGPDEQNIWYDQQKILMMGHTRLAIIDISGGNQPIRSHCGRYTMVYNGEIYNYLHLKKTLCDQGSKFYSDSDTEVLLKAIEHWGLQKAVSLLAGMYAFALWDQNTQILHLVRDRVGIKPLYYAKLNNYFVFSSELQPIMKHPAFEEKIDRNALALYMKYKYVPYPHSIFTNVYKLPPATILSISPPLPADTHLQKYWDIGHLATNNPPLTDFTEACEQLEHILRTSVKEHMLSDVPLGAFLSGGIDSATITALMTQHHSRVKTFNIGFAESSHNESQIAASIARHLQTEHTAFILTMKEAQNTISVLPQAFDEPFADSSQLPTLLVAKMAKKHIKVVLSGDGGDEVFAGYNRYLFVPKVMRMSRLPCRTLLSKLLLSTPNFIWDYVGFKKWQLSDRIAKLANVLAMNSPQHIYNYLISCWQSPIVLGANPVQFSGNISHDNIVQDMMLHDFSSYLVDDILTKVDRATMFSSIEARVPYLDHRVVEFASRIPLHMKIHNGIGKYVLRKILYKYVPPSLFQQPKMGFALPLHAWLRDSLKDWVQDHLSSPLLQDFFDTSQIMNMWQQHKSARKNYQEQLWSVLMFKLWLENYRKKNV
ncbi:asparagine synthase (glutamine-hydrolyzing) [Candidatus Uabimicrobium amorphum]|uniref:asparagine synthase (glutamine-hydrolyzing) n=1 Tax=Uabimicrobium amorphum TaxID=2596890 RepID=A0A5S9F1E6_UABAM|nr:asparagine synthase (glutamine-hydrolyzing) [Candidatus Uabimicrobium amorphum]BBM82322.1 asparagine synthetase B [Candidatus Uabimicrobium amorphum]